MKKLLFPIMIIAIFVALYEQSLPQSNVIIMVIAIVFFMAGMMWLSSKTPSKNNDKEHDDV